MPGIPSLPRPLTCGLRPPRATAITLAEHHHLTVLPAAEPILRDAVAGERGAGERIDRPIGRAVLDQRTGEVAGTLRLRRHERGPRQPALLAVPFLGAEELHPVLDDRSAERSAEIVDV